jgi:hypothetical protein
MEILQRTSLRFPEDRSKREKGRKERNSTILPNVSLDI